MGTCCPSAQPVEWGFAARRTAMLTAWRPDLEVVPIRGNVPTRVQKLLDGDVDAIILARAGLHRLQLDLHPLSVFVLEPEIWLPAPGQRAIAVQTRLEDRELQEVLGRLSNPVQAQAVALERQALAFSEGGCHVPFGALAEREEEAIGNSEWGSPSQGCAYKCGSGAIDGLAKRASRLAEGQSLEPHSLWRLLDDPCDGGHDPIDPHPDGGGSAPFSLERRGFDVLQCAGLSCDRVDKTMAGKGDPFAPAE